jgi:hypothetical protein
MRKNLIIVPAGFAALAIGVSLTACSPSSSTTPAPSPSSSTTLAAPPSSAAPTPAPPSTSSAPVTAPSTPSLTSSQQQAVTSAQGYLSDGEGFSYNGLLQQLTSSAGDGFSNADASFALNYLHPDWNAQAAIAAKGYLSDGEGFSRTSLIQQLTSSYGDGFTQAQAEYGVDQAGL